MIEGVSGISDACDREYPSGTHKGDRSSRSGSQDERHGGDEDGGGERRGVRSLLCNFVEDAGDERTRRPEEVWRSVA